MAEYNPSKIIKDGNTYNFRDDTKIPLAGSNAISGSLIPSTNNSIDIGSSTKNIKMLYTKGITINGTQFLPSNYIPLAGTNALAGSIVPATNNAYDFGSSNYGFKNVYACKLILKNSYITRTVNDDYLGLCGGTDYSNGAYFTLYGKDSTINAGVFRLRANDGTNSKDLIAKPDGTLTWGGQPIQYTSDQRYKQQIAEIDDKLLDAWEDVDLVQFKYNDAVDQKKDKARLHTGYVVQQIDEACKSHNVDISKYGLYCHEEYPEETEEVEVTQDDGTTTKKTEVVRPASEHYSLRYTEALIVECAYLRKCIKELRTEIEQLKSSK